MNTTRTPGALQEALAHQNTFSPVTHQEADGPPDWLGRAGEWLMNSPAFRPAIVPTWAPRLDPTERQKKSRRVDGKIPMAPWLDQATSDATLRRLFDDWSPSTCGFALNLNRIDVGDGAGVAVLDVDPRNGGAETIGRLFAEHGEPPRTPKVRSGGGGTHWYFMASRAVLDEVRRSATDLGPGVELLKGNHLVQAPPSLHKSGSQYAWLVAPWQVSFAELPDWIVTAMRQQARPAPTPLESIRQQVLRMRYHDQDRHVIRARAYLAKTPGAVQGRGGYAHTNSTLYKAVAGFDLTDAEGVEVAREWNARCEPPWSDREIVSKVQAINRCGGSRGWLRNADRTTSRKPRQQYRIVCGRVATAIVPAAIDQPDASTAPDFGGRDPLFDLMEKNPRYRTAEAIRQRDEELRREREEANVKASREAAARERERRKAMEFCPRRKTIVVTGKEGGRQDGKILTFQPVCNSHSCPGCKNMHIRRYSNNYWGRLLASIGGHRGGHEGPAWIAENVAADDYDARRKQITRQKGNYFAQSNDSFVSAGDGSWLVVSDVPFKGARETTRSAAAKVLCLRIELYSGQRKPGCASTRAWAFPKAEGRAEFETLGMIDGDLPADIDRRLAAERAHLQPVEISPQWDLIHPNTANLIDVRGFSKSRIRRIENALFDVAPHRLRFKCGGRRRDPDDDVPTSGIRESLSRGWDTGPVVPRPPSPELSAILAEL